MAVERPFQKIAEIVIMINSRSMTSYFSVHERAELKNKIEPIIQRIFQNHNKQLRIEYTYTNKGELDFVISIYVEFISLYKNVKEHDAILNSILSFLDTMKNHKIFLNENEAFIIAVKDYSIASREVAIKLFEKAKFTLLKEKNGNHLFEKEEDLINFFSEKLRENYYFINCQENTGLHEVDIKLAEARYCLSIDLTISAIIMLCVTTEEFLKSLLKYKLIKSKMQENDEKGNLELLSEFSLQAHKKYGSLTLGKAIQLAENELIIDADEKKRFKDLQTLRDGYVHSDKSKMFSKNKIPIQLLQIDNGELRIVEEKEMNLLENIFIQGLSQKDISDREAKTIFFDIEDLIHTVNQKFRKVIYKKND